MADKPTKLKNKETAFRSNEELIKQVEARIKKGNKVNQEESMQYIKAKGLKDQALIDFYDKNMSQGFLMKNPSKWEREEADPNYKVPTTDADIKNWRKYNTGVESMKADSVPSQLKRYLINTGYAESNKFGSGDTLEGKRIYTRAKSVGINPEMDAEGNFKLADDVNTFKDTDKTFGKTRTINPNAKYVKKVYTKGKDIVNNYELAVPPTYQGKVPTEQELKDFDSGNFYQVGANSQYKKVYVPYLDPKKVPQNSDASTVNANNQEMVNRYNTAQGNVDQINAYKGTEEYKQKQIREENAYNTKRKIAKVLDNTPFFQIGVNMMSPRKRAEGGTIEYTNNMPTEDMYANGGMIKRADGSYSKRGLWDNIRANKGSGKAPTKEMLKQERKINAKYAGGGLVLGENMYGMGGYLPMHADGDYVGASPIKYPAMNTSVPESSGYNRNVMPVVGGHTMSPEEVAAARQQKIYGSMVAQNQNDAYRKNYDANKTQAFNQPTIRAEGTAKTATPMATSFAKNAHTGWKERLAAETAATGDKLRVSNMPNTFDDYFNVPSLVGEMASHIGQAPLQSQETHSAMPWVTALGEPLAAGALSAAIHPMVHKMHVPTTSLVEGAVAGNLIGNATKLGMNQLVKRGVNAAEHQGLTAIKGQLEGGGAHHAYGGMVTPKYRYSNGRFLPMHTPGGEVGGETVVGTPPATRFQKMGGMNMVGAVANPLIDMASNSGNERYLSENERNVQGGLNTVADVAMASGNPFAIGAGLAVKGGVALYNGLDLGGSAAEGRAKEKTYNTNVQNTKNIYGVGDQSIARQSYNNNNSYAHGGMTVINRNHPNPQEEVEGGESAMLPSGKNVQFNGPKHTNGGIKTSLPEGTRIFSDQLIYPGKK